ncbi:unnamed protein product [Alopecurus aequalis]
MAKRKLAPNRGKHSAAKEAEESSLQLGALTAARDRAPPFASDAAENTAPPFASDAAENTAPPSPKNTASSGPAPEKKTAPDLAKNTAASFALDKNKGSASANNKAPAPDKNKASASAKNAVAVPAASDEDEVAAPPQDTKLRRFINFLREKAASMSLQGLLDAFLTWVHSSAGHDTSDASSAEAPTEGSDHQEQREKRYLKDTKNAQQQASPQSPEHERDFNQAEANRIIPAGPSISKIFEDSQKFDRYLSSDIHKDYIKIMSSCPPGMEVCAFCYFEKDVKTRRSQSRRIPHLRQCHNNLTGVKCTNCPARFPTEGIRDLHGMYCNA